ncbi:MAG: hypothetical protein ABI769_00535 [Pseudomonadota bacterium]
MSAHPAVADVLRVGATADASILRLTGRYGVELRHCAADESLPGSYWGDSEAGLQARVLYVRADTPLHSLLHELSHFVCMSADRRAGLDRDAGGDDAEECAVCYLQVLLADELPMLGRDRMFADMDAWGYTFRLGSSRAWFERDAVDSCIWLRRNGVVDEGHRPTFLLKT